MVYFCSHLCPFGSIRHECQCVSVTSPVKTARRRTAKMSLRRTSHRTEELPWFSRFRVGVFLHGTIQIDKSKSKRVPLSDTDRPLALLSIMMRMFSISAKSAITGQCLLIFHSVGFEFAYFGEDLCEPIGEPVKTLTVVAVRERAAEDLQRML